MKTIKEVLRDSDPLRHESLHTPEQLDTRRQTILAAATDSGAQSGAGSRSRILVLASVALILIAALFLGSRTESYFVIRGHAAVRFEVRLAEDMPAPGLREAKVAGTNRSVYLYEDVVVTNSDIAQARLIQDAGSSQYKVGVEFNAAGTEKMRAATENHIGRPVAILLDDQVVMAPLLRARIEGAAEITGNFTKEQAERIVNGIQ